MYKILLVDDDDIIKIGLRTIVEWEKYGFQIMGTAENGEEALKMLDTISPDVVITDIIMPKMNGIELIENLQSRNFQGLIIVLSNYGDISYVKKAMKMGAEDYILKVACDKKEFEELLVKMGNILKAKKHVNREHGNQKNRSELEEYLLGQRQNCGIETNKYYHIMAIKLPKHILELENELYQQFCQKIKVVLEETLYKKGDVSVFFGEKGMVFLSFYTQVELLGEHVILPEKIFKTLSLYLMIQSTIVYSLNLKNLKEMKSAFNECREKTNISFYYPTCISQEEVKFENIYDVLNPIKIANRYREYVKMQNLEQMQNELQEMVLNFQENLVEPIEVKDFLRQVVVAVQLYYDEIFSENVLNGMKSRIKNAVNIEQLHNIINDMIEELAEVNLSMENEKQDIQLIEKIKAYIDENINTRLYLNEIAEHMNFHPNYVSSYFKQKTGQTVSQYINRKKMEYAKSLLDNGCYRVREISEKVGFEDPLYFSRCFKKYFGYSPSKGEDRT